MILHTDIPTRANVIDPLLVNRDPASVSIYVPTDPASSNAGPRTALRNLGEKALQQLRSAGIGAPQVAAIEEERPICSTIRRSGAIRRGRWRCC